MRFLAGNAQHIGARHSQQDSFGFGETEDPAFIEHAGVLAVVCDGMGGMEFGDAASRTAVRAFLDAYHRKTPEEAIPDALARSVRESNDQVLTVAARVGLVEGMGTTLVAAALHDGSLFFVSVGDSGIFLLTGSEIRLLNRPHIFGNVLDAAVTRGSMSAEDAAAHPERESLTSYIGAQRLEEVDHNQDPIPLAPGSAILLASDGLFKTLSVQEMLACCQGPPQAWPDALVEATLAKKRGYQDNVTVLSLAIESTQTAPRTASVAPVGPVVPPQSKRSLVFIVLIVIAVLAAAAAGWWYLREHRGISQQQVTDPGKAVQAPRGNPLPPAAPDPKGVQILPQKEPR